jgi:hypothetical protein
MQYSVEVLNYEATTDDFQVRASMSSDGSVSLVETTYVGSFLFAAFVARRFGVPSEFVGKTFIVDDAKPGYSDSVEVK